MAPIVIQESPVGSMDGVNDTFTLNRTPLSMVSVNLNGCLQMERRDYFVRGGTVRFAQPPYPGSDIIVTYDSNPIYTHKLLKVTRPDGVVYYYDVPKRFDTLVDRLWGMGLNHNQIHRTIQAMRNHKRRKGVKFTLCQT